MCSHLKDGSDEMCKEFNNLNELSLLPENDKNDRLVKKQIRKCGDVFFISCYTAPNYRDQVGTQDWYETFDLFVAIEIGFGNRYQRVMEDFNKVSYMSHIGKPSQQGFAVIKNTLKGKTELGLALGENMSERYWNMTRLLHPRSDEHIWIKGMFEELKKDINYKGSLGGSFYFRLQGVDYGY